MDNYNHSYISFLENTSSLQESQYWQNAEKYHQASSSGKSTDTCEPVHPEVPRPPPTCEQYMSRKKKKLSELGVPKDLVVQDFPASNHPRHPLTNEISVYQPNTLPETSQLKPNDNFDYLTDLFDEILNTECEGRYDPGQPPQQTNIFIGCQFISQLPPSSTLDTGSSNVFDSQSSNHSLCQKAQEPMNTQWQGQTHKSAEMVVHESGFTDNQHAPGSNYAITYSSIPKGLINQSVDEHFKRASSRTVEMSQKRLNSDGIDTVLSTPTKMPFGEPLTIDGNDSNHPPRNSSSHNQTKSTDNLIIQTDSKEKPFQCGYLNCERAYKRVSHLKAHFIVHTGISDHKCSYLECHERYFRDRSTLNRHIRSRHTKEKPYKCKLCDRSFHRQDHLKLHLNRTSHQGYTQTH